MTIHDRHLWSISEDPGKPAVFTGNPRDYMVKDYDLKWWLEFSTSLKFRFAFTMSSTPHSYVVRHQSCKNEDYRRAFGVVNTFGQPGKFWDRTNIYLHDRDTERRWWNMINHEYASIILNQATDGREYGVQDAPATKPEWGWSPFDSLGVYFDDVHAETVKAEQVALWKTCDRALDSGKPKTLDLGAGTGATLDSRICGQRDTTVVDVSQGMLNALVLKYPRIGTIVPASAEEFLSWETGSYDYDLVIASFGAASHLSPEVVDELPNRSRKAVVLSFYKPGYRPEWMDLLEMEIDDSETIAHALDFARGQSEVQGNYLTITFKGG